MSEEIGKCCLCGKPDHPGISCIHAKGYHKAVSDAERRERIATEAGLSFQRELIKQSKIPLTGATYKLREDIEAIDPKAWESICYAVADQILTLFPKPELPKIVCLCGSTRFQEAFYSEYARLSDMGIIVLTVSRLIPDHRETWDFAEQERIWHTLHFRKIDLADEVRVLNVGGYIGKSLKAEIEYATKIGKPITYLEAQLAMGI